MEMKIAQNVIKEKPEIKEENIKCFVVISMTNSFTLTLKIFLNTTHYKINIRK